MKKLILWVMFIMTISSIMAQGQANVDLKKLFSTKSWPIVSGGFTDDSVSLETQIFFKSAPALKIDCSRDKEKNCFRSLLFL